MENEISLEESIEQINVNTITSDVDIYSDNVRQPIVRYTGDFDIESNYSKATIIEKQNLEAQNIQINTGFFGKIKTSIFGTKVTMNGGSVKVRGNTIIVNNGSGVSINNGIVTSSTPGKLEIVIPQRKDDLSFNIEVTNGDISIQDLILKKLYIKTTVGDITLREMDALITKLQTVSGDVDAEILESIINYQTFLKTINGSTIQRSDERISPVILSEKHELNANSVNGDIKILFKGKR